MVQSMEPVVAKYPLRAADSEAVSSEPRSPEESLRAFEEPLRRGQALFYPHETPEGYPRVHRVVALRVIGRDVLIRNKRAAGRTQGLADAERLEKRGRAR